MNINSKSVGAQIQDSVHAIVGALNRNGNVNGADTNDDIVFYEYPMNAMREEISGREYKCFCGGTFTDLEGYTLHITQCGPAADGVSDDGDNSDYARNKSKLKSRSKSKRRVNGSNGSNDDKKNEKKYKWNVCGKSFSEKEYLRPHSYQHKTIKPYNCKYCSYGAALKNSVDSHEKIHKNAAYKCDIKGCGWSSKFKGRLAEHYRLKHNIMYKEGLRCKYCDKSFDKETDLKHHLDIHAYQEKPYKCGVCSKSFRTDKMHRQHLCNKHPEIYYKDKNQCK